MKRNLLLLGFLITWASAAVNASQVISVDPSTQGILVPKSVFSKGIRTVECWFKPGLYLAQGTFSQYAALIARDNSSQNEEWGLFFNHNDGSLRFYRRIGTTQYEINANGTDWQAGTYYHVVAVIDSLSGMSLYVDGVKQTMTDSSVAAITMNNDDTYIAQWGNLNIRHFTGELENFRMWSRALSHSEITNLGCDLDSTEKVGLELWLDMENVDTIAQTILDVSSNALSLSYSGSLFIASDNLCTTVTSVDLLESTNKVYPNPSSGLLYIESASNVEKVEVFNLLGDRIRVERGRVSVLTLDRGVYLLKITAEGGKSSIVKVVVN